MFVYEKFFQSKTENKLTSTTTKIEVKSHVLSYIYRINRIEKERESALTVVIEKMTRTNIGVTFILMFKKELEKKN